MSIRLPTLLLACCALPAQALEPLCDTYLKAVEKTSTQPARQMVSDLGEGLRTEAIVIDNKMYMKVDGAWMKGPPTFTQMEAKLNAELRSGKTKLWGCKKLGRETVDGIATTVYSYEIDLHGLPAPKEPAKVYVGDDGLIYAQSSDGAKVRYRYTGVTAPKVGQ
ncbi:MAG: hypothetical protein V4709_08455 [Pseudomonadota bacterium]